MASDKFDAKSFLKTLTTHPGVYQMENATGEILYVGKASNLKNRVSSYFTKQSSGIKTQTLVQQIAHITVTITANESEALLLENSLIKKFKPKYNILLRDDKSYPYLFVSTEEQFPRIEFYRAKKRSKKGLYFGPYPNAAAVKETLYTLQKIFKIRACSPVFFSHRSRPCLQYQIHRCSAPCVNYINPEEYRIAINSAIQFLQGKNQTLITDLEKRMEEASLHLHFEQAAHYRDQIINLQQIQAKKQVLAETEDLDILAVSFHQGMACIHQMQIRAGQAQGGRNFYPSVPASWCEDEMSLLTSSKERRDSDEESAEDRMSVSEGEEGSKLISSSILEAFITQYYLSTDHEKEIPATFILSQELPHTETLEKVLSQLRGKKCTVTHRVRSIRSEWLQTAIQNSEIALQAHIGSHSTLKQRFKALQVALNLPELPHYLECFDISHTSGEATVASCVIFDQNGPKKNQYRHFNIHGIQPGDDYAAMRQALLRRYSQLQKDEAILPDVLFIDGGKGQVKQAMEVLAQLNITEILCIGIAKGSARKPGLETLILMNADQKTMTLESDSPALHLIQHIRDESHRFAVLGHTRQRDKKRIVSVLEAIEGIGAKRRQALYRRFGGLQEVKKAHVDAIAKVPGISKALAEKIYQALH